MSRYRGRSWGYSSFSRDYDKRKKQKELQKKEKQRYLQNLSEKERKEYTQKERDINSITMSVSAIIVFILWLLINGYGG